MKLRDLTEEQADKICDYICDKYGVYDEHGIWKNSQKCCCHCPFGITSDGYYDCCQGLLFNDLPEEFEEVIKND